jgi:hypothetical protein
MLIEGLRIGEPYKEDVPALAGVRVTSSPPNVQ